MWKKLAMILIIYWTLHRYILQDVIFIRYFDTVSSDLKWRPVLLQSVFRAFLFRTRVYKLYVGPSEHRVFSQKFSLLLFVKCIAYGSNLYAASRFKIDYHGLKQKWIITSFSKWHIRKIQLTIHYHRIRTITEVSPLWCFCLYGRHLPSK